MSANKDFGVLRKQSRMAKNDGIQILTDKTDLQHCHLSSFPHQLSCLLLPHLYYLQTSYIEECLRTKGTKPFHSSKLHAHEDRAIQEKLTRVFSSPVASLLLHPVYPVFSNPFLCVCFGMSFMNTQVIQQPYFQVPVLLKDHELCKLQTTNMKLLSSVMFF